MMQILRSALFSVSMMLSTLVFAILGSFTLPFPYATRYAFIRNYARFNLRVLEHVCGVRYEVEGRENIPDGACIVFSKHQSTWETLAMQELFPPQVWVLKRELLWLPFFGWGLALLKPIAIDRNAGRKAIRQVVEQGIARLRAGIWVIIFPEGTRLPPGQRIRYRLGGAVLAAKSGFPVLPVAHNAGELWPRGGFVKRPGTVRVVIGAPIPSEGRTAEAISAEAEAFIEGAMDRITGTARSGATRRSESSQPNL